MGYDRANCFPFDFEPNGSPFGSKSKGNGSKVFSVHIKALYMAVSYGYKQGSYKPAINRFGSEVSYQ